MKLINLIQRPNSTTFKVIAVIGSVLLLTACGAQEQQTTPTATLQPLATMTPVPTATAVPTLTNTPEPATDTPTAAATPTPTPVPTDTPAPVPTAPPADTPTVTPVPLIQVSDARVIYHDAEKIIDNIATYEPGVEPWMDLLVRLDDNWYGPERNEDDINAAPLPDGYRWETQGSFSSLPNGEVWWTAPGVEGKARLIGPDGSELVTLELKIDLD
jgi:hypothetical protein